MKYVLEARSEGKPPVRLELKAGRRIVVGRGDDADLKVEGEGFISRRHVEAVVEEGKLKAKRIPTASNPVIFQGHDSNEYSGGEFAVGLGDFFVIGNTRFVFVGEADAREAAAPAEQAPNRSGTVEEKELYRWGGHSDRMRMLDLLQLPEMLRTLSREQAYVHIAGLIRMATAASWAGVAREDGIILASDATVDAPLKVNLSRSLMKAALENAPKPTWYSWAASAGDIKATVQEGADWAICAAMKIPGEPSLVLYVMGRGEVTGAAGGAQLENSRYVGLVADMVGRALSVRRLEVWQGRLQRFFAGAVINKILDSADSKELEPRVAEGTVMFFDLRGFSRRTEDRNEKILGHLGELRSVMTVMTGIIFEEEGVVLQYQGDAILACWNVPIADPRHVDRACRAAMKMCSLLRSMSGGWNCGIGIHSGEVVAGSVGSDQMFSYTVMGPVVNQASRIEGITKQVELPVLVTREVAKRLSVDVASSMRIGKFQPAGMTAALELYELVPPPGDPKRAGIFSAGLELFEAGNWERAYEVLDPLPSSDRPARYIKTLTEQYRRHPPPHWRGVIELSEK